MEFEIVDGVKYQLGTEAHKAACERRDSAKAKLTAEVEALRKQSADEKARADKADADLKKATDEFKAALTPERLDAAVKARASITQHAQVIMADEIKAKKFTLDGLTNGEIKLACVQKSYPSLRLDTASRDYVNGLWRGIVAKREGVQGERQDAADRLLRETAPFPTSVREDRAGAKSGARTLAQVRQDALDESRARSSRPLALSRRAPSKTLTQGAMLQGAQLEVMK